MEPSIEPIKNVYLNIRIFYENAIFLKELRFLLNFCTGFNIMRVPFLCSFRLTVGFMILLLVTRWIFEFFEARTAQKTLHISRSKMVVIVAAILGGKR